MGGATILEAPGQLQEVMSWAEEASQYVNEVLIIPKYSGAIAQLPRSVGGAMVRLAYSVPTRYAGTDVPVWEFSGWPVHLLGGSPHKQIDVSAYMDVVSTDGNMAQKLALQFSMFWQPGTFRSASNRWWPQLGDIGMRGIEDAPYAAFAISCAAIYAAWHNLPQPDPLTVLNEWKERQQ
jgi:hypothetical protein